MRIQREKSSLILNTCCNNYSLLSACSFCLFMWCDGISCLLEIEFLNFLIIANLLKLNIYCNTSQLMRSSPCCMYFNHLSTNPSKWSNSPRNSSSAANELFEFVFYHFVGLALKGLRCFSSALPDNAYCWKHPLLCLQVLGKLDEFDRQVEYVIKNVSFDTDVVVSVFETNIRVVGYVLPFFVFWFI